MLLYYKGIIGAFDVELIALEFTYLLHSKCVRDYLVHWAGVDIHISY